MRIILISFLLFFGVHIYSQDITLEYGLGYATYKLTDLRKFQDWIRVSSELGDVAWEATESFPPQLTHNIAIGHVIKQHHFGLDFSYYTTGSRLHWADYSGFLLLDMVLNGYRIGGFYNYSLIETPSKLDLCLQVGSGLVVSNVEMKENLTIYSNSLIETNELKGIGGYCEPAIVCKYGLFDRLSLYVHLGYEYDFRGELKVDGDKVNMNAQWSGLRVSGGVVFLIPTIY